MNWKSADGKVLASKLIGELEILINGMLGKATLLDLVRSFIVFEKSSFEDPKTKIVRIETVKKLAAYHQYYAVNKAVDSVKLATSEGGNRKGGVIWHTQGSGKSFSMVFTAAKLVRALDNPTILVITDRNDLDNQLFDTFAASKQLLRQDPIQAENREDLKKLLKVASGRLAKINLSDEGKKLVEELDEDLEKQDLSETGKAKAKWTQLEALIGSEDRVRNIAKDIVSHFEARQQVFDGKGMIVSMSRRIARRALRRDH